VAHNSFVNSTSDRGLVGGGIFFGRLLCLGLSLWKLRKRLRRAGGAMTDGSCAASPLSPGAGGRILGNPK